MDPRNPSELLPFLKGDGLWPKKSLSQNFLIDANVLRKIVRTAGVTEGSDVLEIGPGPGALTKTLLESGAHVTAVEIDQRFATRLPPHPRLTVIQADFLSYIPTKPALVVANIPYHITSPIIAHLATFASLWKGIYLTVQKDMAERIMAKKGSRDNNAFAIFTQFYFTPRIAFSIPSHCFYPKPKVASALLSLTPHEQPLSDPAPFFAFVRLLFQQKTEDD